MLKHILKISLRGLWKNKLYVIINALGLGVSLACCMAAYLWVAYDLEFDDFHKDEKVADIYKVHSHWIIPDVGQNILSPYALAPTAHGDISGISSFARYYFEKGSIEVDSHNSEEGIAFADSSFLEMFNFEVTDGALASFKREQYAVIGERLSKKLFGKSSPIGKVLNVRLSDQKTFSVVIGAVIKDIPHNSSFTFELLARVEQFANVRGIMDNDWSVWPAFSTFFEIPEKDQVSAIAEQLQSYIALEEGDHSALTLEPFKADYTMSEILGAMVNVRMWQAPILALAVTALMIFLITCFNLANTSYALSIRRVKEIGMRRILGADKRHIFALFFLETILIIMLAMVIGLAVAQYIVPSFAEMWADGISNRWDRLVFGVKDVRGINLLIFLMLITFFGVAAAGSFPALFHSRVSAAQSLKGNSRTHGFNGFSQVVLVVQFSLSVVSLFRPSYLSTIQITCTKGTLGLIRIRPCLLS